jgi:hypothetical protein
VRAFCQQAYDSLSFDNETAQFQFSPGNFSCGTRQEHRYHLASVTTELNLAPHLLQLQNCGTAKP